MRRILRRTVFFSGVVLTSLWPLLLCGAIAGWRGIWYGLMAYLSIAALLLVVLLFGGIRGIIDY